MQLKTILNRVERYKSFVYGEPRWADDARSTIEVPIEPRANGRPICSGCGKRRPGYDRLPPRRFEFVPLWEIAVFFVYAMRRVDCPGCGVVVERVPWARGKGRLTTTLSLVPGRLGQAALLGGGGQRLPHHLGNVCDSVRHAVSWGLVHRDLSGATSHRRGRDPVAAGPPLPDAGLPDRRGLQAAAVGRPRADRGQPAPGFGSCWAETFGCRPAFRVQRHVAAVSESDRRASRRSDPRPRPLPHHEEDERGDRRGPRPARPGG